MVIQAWYPLGHGDKTLIQEPIFSKLAEKYGKGNAQIILRWHIQDGNVVIPGSKNPDHIRANFDLFDFSLSDAEMARSQHSIKTNATILALRNCWKDMPQWCRL